MVRLTFKSLYRTQSHFVRLHTVFGPQ